LRALAVFIAATSSFEPDPQRETSLKNYTDPAKVLPAVPLFLKALAALSVNNIPAENSPGKG
jgi:hypothetical protein